MPRKKAIFSLFLLCGCMQTPEQHCTVPKQWSKDEQIAIAKERNQLPPDDIIRFVLDDWERMRRESR